MDVVGDLTVDQSSSHFASNYNENSKEKRKRTNSIMQIEKQIENKIVKGWNQMIYDLTPKVNPVGLGVSCNADDDRVDLDFSEKTDYRNVSRLPENIPTTLKLDLVELDTKKYRCRSTAQISPTCKNYIISVFTLEIKTIKTYKCQYFLYTP